jgi:hypothetical protein
VPGVNKLLNMAVLVLLMLKSVLRFKIIKQGCRLLSLEENERRKDATNDSSNL